MIISAGQCATIGNIANIVIVLPTPGNIPAINPKTMPRNIAMNKISIV
jgi:hypothetical protein